jgi:hypothetical protein
MMTTLEKMAADMKLAMGADGAEWACEGHSDKAWQATARAALQSIRTLPPAILSNPDMGWRENDKISATVAAVIDAILNEKTHD